MAHSTVASRLTAFVAVVFILLSAMQLSIAQSSSSMFIDGVSTEGGSAGVSIGEGPLPPSSTFPGSSLPTMGSAMSSTMSGDPNWIPSSFDPSFTLPPPEGIGYVICDLAQYKGFVDYGRGPLVVWDYDPCLIDSALTSPKSGYPLKFVKSFHNYSGMRMMINQEVSRTTLRPAFRALTSASGQPTQVLLYAAISVTSFDLTSLTVNGAARSQFVAFDGASLSLDQLTKTAECGDHYLMAQSPLSGIVTGNGNVTGGRFVVKVEGDTSTQTSASCNGASYLAVVLHANVPFAKGPINRFAAMENKISASQLSNLTFVNEMISRAWEGDESSTASVLHTSASLADMPPNRFIFSGSVDNPALSAPSIWKGVVPFLSASESSYSAYSSSQPISGASRIEAPIDMALLTVEEQLASLRSRKVPMIGPSTTKQVQCDIAEVAGYAMERIPAGNVSSDLGIETSCLHFATVDDAQQACSLKSDCIGVSSSLQLVAPVLIGTSGTAAFEVPLCLHLRTELPQPLIPFRYPRIFYRRPTRAMRTCVVGTEVSGKVAVWVQQSHFYTSTATVRVNNDLVSVCGAADTFQNQIIGLDGACNTYALCYSGPLPSNSVVHVEVTEDLLSHGCDTALSTVVQLWEVDDIQQEATTEAPVARLPVDGPNFRSRIVSKTSLLPDQRVTIAVRNATSLALEVVQSGYECPSSGSCPNYVIKMCAGKLCQVCGGLAGFYNNHRAGKSDRLGLTMFCGELLEFSSAFTGTVSIEVDTTAMTFRTNDASSARFGGMLHASCSLEDPDLVFPFVQTIDNVLLPTTYLGVQIPLSTAATFNAQNAAEAMGALPGTTRLALEVGPLESRFALFPFPFAGALASAPSGDTRFNRLPSSSVQVCVIDHTAGALTTTCNFYTPHNATQVRIELAQTDFVDLANVAIVKYVNVSGLRTAVDVATQGSSMQEVHSTSCGGANNFGASTPTKNKCGTFLTCANSLVVPHSLVVTSYADGPKKPLPPVVVKVEIPGSMNSLSCTYTSMIIATFSTTQQEEIKECSASEFRCPASNKCLHPSQLCNNIQDCQGGEDESHCIQWYPLPPNETFALEEKKVQRFHQNSGFAGCLARAVFYQAPTFTFTSDSCVLVGADTSAEVYAAPSRYILTNTTVPAQTLVRLPNGPSQYARCSASVHCQGHGTLIIPAGQTSLRDSQACNCKCDAGFLGETCGIKRSLEETGKLVVAFEIASPFDTYSIRALTIAKAIKGSSVVDVTCDQVYIASTNVSRAFVECEVDHSDLQQASIFRAGALDPDAWPSINTRLSKEGHRTLVFISRAGVINSFQEVPSTACNLTAINANGTSVAACSLTPTITAVGGDSNRIRVSTYSSRAAWWITRKAHAAVARRMATADTTAAVKCAAAATSGTCIRSTCDFFLPYSNTTTSATSDVELAITFRDENLGTCADTTLEVSVLSDYGNAPTETSESVENQTEDFTPILVFGCVMLVAGVSFGVAAGVVFFKHLAESRDFEEHSLKYIGGDGNRETDLSVVGELMFHKSAMASHLVLQYRNQGQWGCLKRRVATVVATLSALFVLGGILAMLAFTSSYNFSSNFSVVYSEYSDDGCAQSPVSSVPASIFVTETEGRGCSRVQMHGASFGTVYVRTTCTGFNGNYQAEIQLGGSEQACLDSKVLTVDSDVCLPVSAFFPGATRYTFASVTCTTNALAEAKVNAVLQASRVPNPTVLINPSNPPENLMNFNLNSKLLLSDGTIATPFLAGSSSFNSTATVGNVVGASTSAQYAFGEFDGTRMVAQFHSAITTPPRSKYQPSAFEDSLRPYIFTSPLPATLQAQLSAVTLTDTPYPLGFTFNGFATATSTPLNSPNTPVAKEAQRYYYIRNTPFDMGAWLTYNTAIAEDTGFSISLYMRATTETEGFAFAVADVYENIQTKKSILLEKLATMIRSSEPQSGWFEDNYGVYSSFYINGPGASVSFAYADPESSTGEDANYADSEPYHREMYGYAKGEYSSGREESEVASRRKSRLVQIDWNLKELGVERLLNGEWHHLAIVFRAEGSRMIAQLMVDGETSYTDKGWSQCVSHVPSRVKHFRSDADMMISDIQYEHMWNDGALYVGYFNGAIYGLTYTPGAVQQGEYLAQGTEEMRLLDSFPTDEIYSLGITLMVFGGVGAVLIVTLSGKEYLQERSSQEREFEENLAKYFYTIMLGAMKASDGKLHPIRLSTAMRWTRMTPRRLSLVLPDAHPQSSTSTSPTDGLLRVLYNSRRQLSDGDNIFVNPTVEDWNSLVDQDQLQHASSKRFFCLPPTDEIKADLRLTGGEDYLDFSNGHNGSGDASGTLDVEKLNNGGGDGEVAGDDGVEQISELKGAILNIQVKMAQISLDSLQIHQLRVLKMDVIFQHLSPLIAVLQSLYVWSTSMRLPELYDSNFKELFSVFSFDFATFFPQVPTLLVLLPTLLILALVGVGLVIFLSIEDNKLFESNLIRYVWRRDSLEGGEELEMLQGRFDTYTQAVIQDTHEVPAPDLICQGLSFSDCRKIDVLNKKMPAHTNDDLNILTQGVVSVESVHYPGTTLVASREGKEGTMWASMTGPDAHQDLIPEYTSIMVKENPNDVSLGCCTRVLTRELASDEAVQLERKRNALRVKEVGIYCWRHPSRLLSSQTQTDIWPFTNPPTCQMAIGGKPCGRHTGELFTCGKCYTDAQGVERVCNFALCAQHCRMTVLQTLASKGWGIIARLFGSGFSWLLCLLLVTLANIAYTPFLKTAFMILACHPYYQCEFEHCWRNADQKYILAVYLSIVVVVFFGVGLPLSQFWLLRYRKIMMEPFFRATEYAGRYLSKAKSLFQGTLVDDDEWERFVSTDPTALASMYDSGYHHWLYLAPLLTLWKAIALLPAIFAEPGGFPQRIGIAMVELLMGVFLFATKGQMDLIVNISFRLGSTHQLLILGLDNLQVVAAHMNQDTTTYQNAMVGVTASYVFICMCILLSTVLVPVIGNAIDKRATKQFLNMHGCVFTQATGLYLDPLGVAANHETIVNTTRHQPRFKNYLASDQADEELDIVGDKHKLAQSTTTSSYGNPPAAVLAVDRLSLSSSGSEDLALLLSEEFSPTDDADI